MQAVLGTLLAALLAGPALSLRCFTCDLQPVNATCDTLTRCPSGMDSFCMTKTFEPEGGPAVLSKSCQAACEELPETPFLGSRQFSCCNRDRCNKATSASISYTALLLALGVSSLLYRTRL